VAKPEARGSIPGCSDERWTAIADGKAEPTPAEIAILLAVSAERDLCEKRIDAAWRAGFGRGRACGRREGYIHADAERAAEWQTTQALLIGATESVLNPDGIALRNVRGAVAAERRDAAERERVFVAKAYATADKDRSDAQRAAVRSYPPPSQECKPARGRHLRAVAND
jgi:hypothetical protein